METTTYFCHKQKRMKKIVIGIFVLTAGILLLGFNAKLLDPAYKHVIFSWPVLLIALGIANFFERTSFWTGVILTSIGTFFLIPLLFVFDFNFVHLFWPVLLIIFGIVMILKRTFFRSFFHHRQRNVTSKTEDGYIEQNNIFSGSHQIIQPCEFKGGKISNVFGGSKIDLSRTTLAPGENVLEISCVFGGVELIVPSHWNIQNQVSSVLGAFNDKRYASNSKPQEIDRKLIIKGSTVFGGGEIKSFN